MKRSVAPGLLFLAILIGVFHLPLPGKEIRNIELGWHLLIDDAQNIYTNISPHQIAKYSPEGQRLLLIGQKGEGPGDIKRLGSMALNPNDSLLYVTEFFQGNRRISVFSPVDGRFVKIWPCQLDRNQWPSASTIQFDSRGNVYLMVQNMTWRQSGNVEIGTSVQAIMKFDRSGKFIKELYRLASDMSAYCERKGHPTIPYQNYPYWLIHQDRFYILETRRPFVSVRDLDGAPVKKIPLPFKQIPVTERDVDAWVEWMASFPQNRQMIAIGRLDMTFWKKNLPFPESKSIFSGPLAAGPGNQLFFFINPPAFDSEERIYAFLSLESGKVDTRRFPDGDKLKAFKNDRFYVVSSDEDDEPVLKILEKDNVLKGMNNGALEVHPSK